MTGYYRCRLAAIESDERGSVAVLFGLMSFVILGAAGLAIDYSRWQNQRTEMQTAADAAALAGAVALQDAKLNNMEGAAAHAAEAAAVTYLIENRGMGHQPAVAVDESAGTVTISLKEPGTRTLSALFMSEDVDIDIDAEAVVGETADACVIALDPDTEVGIDLNLSGGLTAHNCAVWSNSRGEKSIDANGSGTVKASITCAAGGIRDANFDFEPGAQQNCDPVVDPLASWTPPSIGACAHHDYRAPSWETVRLSPGVYCGGIRASGTVSLILEPGLYVMRDGALVLAGGASVEGKDVSFLMTGDGSSVDFRGASRVALTAPSSGVMAGLVVASGREENRQESHLRGNSEFLVEGNVYLPTHDLTFAGGPEASLPASFTVLIARTITFNGASAVEVRADYASTSIPAYPAKVSASLRARLVR